VSGSLFRMPVLLLCAFALLSVGRVRADVEVLSLYQMTARAPLVARVRGLSGATRRPHVEVVRIFKGHYAAGTLQVVPTWIDRTDPIPGVEREVFREGEESILFLRPYVDEFGRPGDDRTFSVLSAARGKVDLPSEGSDAVVEAIVRFVQILELKDHNEQGVALRSLLRESSPMLLEAGIEECVRFRFVIPEDADAILSLLAHPRPGFRAGAIGLVRILVLDFPSADNQRLFDSVAGAARLDSDPSVRIGAVRALESFGTEAAFVVIERIGRFDSNQDVRYEAQVAAYHLRDRLREK